MKQLFFYLSCLLFVVLTACTEPITVGNDLLDGDRATLGQTIDIPFTTAVVEDDSLRTFSVDENSALSGFSFGSIQDDVFGTFKSSVYLVPGLPRSPTSGFPVLPAFAFTDRNVDSVVMVMPLDTSFAFYGPGRTFRYRVGKIPTRVDQSQDYYADVELTRSLIDINRDNELTATLTSTLVYDTVYSATGDSLLSPHIRVAFDDAFLADLNMRDETTFETDSALATLFAGMFMEPLDDPDGLIGLEPQRFGQTPISGFYFFYQDTTAEMTPRQYRMPLSLWLPRYDKTFGNSLVGGLLTDGDDLDLVAVAGQEGVMTEITFPDLSALQDKVINQAELQFYVENVDGYDYDVYARPDFIGLYYKDNNGNLVTISDRLFLRNSDRIEIVEAFLGGQPITDENGDIFYRPRFSVHLQRMIAGEVPNKIYMRVIPTDRDRSRMILKGPGNAEQPASVKVTFTEIGG